MNYLYKNNFEEVYQAYVGRIVKIKDSKSKFNNKLMYELGGTSNGFCYKDCDAFKTNPNKVCYIAELAFDDDSFIDSYADISSEQVQVPNKKDGEEQEGENKEELHDEISQDKIEEERRKAHKKREYVKELKARIERIQKEKEEKIAKVKNGKSEEK